MIAELILLFIAIVSGVGSFAALVMGLVTLIDGPKRWHSLGFFASSVALLGIFVISTGTKVQIGF